MAEAPSVLAAFVQVHLATLEDEPPLAARIHETVAPGTLKTIRETSRMSRIPLALHAELTHGLFDATDETTARAICRATVAASFQQPFLEALVTGAMRLLGGELGGVLRWVPKAWSLLYRNAGSMTWMPEGATQGRLVVTGAPEALTGDPTYLTALGAGHEALFDLTGSDGELGIRGGNGEVVMDLRWTRRES